MNIKVILNLFLGTFFISLIGCKKEDNNQMAPIKNQPYNISYIIDTAAKINSGLYAGPNPEKYIKYHPSYSYFQKDSIIKRDWYSIGGSKYRLDVYYPYVDGKVSDTTMNELGFYYALKPYTGIIIWMRIIHNNKDTIFIGEK
jgi:hypothetical protein